MYIHICFRASKGKPLEADVAAGFSAWQQCGATIKSMSLILTSPIVPIWRAPPEPEQKISNLIPTRDLNPAPPTPSPADDFKLQVSKAIQMLAEVYQNHTHPEGHKAAEEDMPLTQRHKALIFELNHSGAYDSMRKSLKAPLIRIVKEELGASGDMSPAEMGPHYGKLYCRVMDLLHTHLARYGIISGSCRIINLIN